MPEGHTIHRLARELARRFGGSAVRAATLQPRFEPLAAALDGATVAGTDAHGKHLFIAFRRPAAQRGAAQLLHVHLGLYGSVRLGDAPPPAPVGELRLRLETADGWADLRGATTSVLITRGERDAIIDRLGPDPLRRDAEPARAWARIARSRAPIGGLLMTQEVVSGIGNVYRAELLYRHRVNPYRPGRELPGPVWDAMWTDLRGLMRAGVRAGRIVTTLPQHRARRARVGPDDAFYVYRRAGLPCRVCGAEVRAAVLQARNLFWCEICQVA